MNNECELKYLVSKDGLSSYEMIIKYFINSGFSIISKDRKINSDYYFDTDNFYLYEKEGSFRIRKVFKDNLIKYKGTYKMPCDNIESFVIRSEIERELENDNINTFIKKMLDCNCYLINIDKIPVSNVLNARTDITLKKDDNMVCVSFDKCTYINYRLNNITYNEDMIEIEMINGDNKILNEINYFISNNIDSLNLIRDSKYKRSLDNTRKLYKKIKRLSW